MEQAKVTVVFRPPDYNVISDQNYSSAIESGRFTSKVPEGYAEFQTTQGLFFFVTDPAHRPLQIQPGFVIPATRYTYTWKQVPVVIGSDGYPNLGLIPNLSTIIGLSALLGLVKQLSLTDRHSDANRR